MNGFCEVLEGGAVCDLYAGHSGPHQFTRIIDDRNRAAPPDDSLIELQDQSELDRRAEVRRLFPNCVVCNQPLTTVSAFALRRTGNRVRHDYHP